MRRSEARRRWAVVLALACALAVPAQSQEDDHGASALFAQADRMLEKVSQIMELDVRQPVRKEMTTRAAVQAYLRHQLGRQHPGSALEDLGDALRFLGLVPQDYDLGAGVVRLLEDQVAGFYDPEKKVFYVADWVPDNLQLPTMAHELAHVLQDQHYDLRPLLTPTPGEQDSDLAFQAVVEGEGVAVMTEVLIGSTGLSLEQVGKMMESFGDISQILSASESMGLDTAALRDTPPYLVKSLLFPYNEGFRFFLAFLAKQGWDGAGALFEDRPVSTEQILHPEKYLETPDVPEPVEAKRLEAALPAGWKVFFRERLGEFTLREVFATRLEVADAARAAAGWDGDRTVMARSPDGGRTVLLFESAWDGEAEAKEAFEAWVEVMRSRHPTATPLELDGDRVAAWTTPAGGVRIWTDGSAVGVVEGLPSSMWATLFPEPGESTGP